MVLVFVSCVLPESISLLIISIRDQKVAEFPDALTTRGSKHLKTLIEAKKRFKGLSFIMIQIQGINVFKLAKDIDNEYFKNYLKAKKLELFF